MQYFWLNKTKENNKLIVFLNGWGMNETPVKHLKYNDFDVLILFDYKNLEFNFKEFEFDKYEKKYLISWSMGVYVASLFKNVFNSFDKKIAINGTTKIIDDDFGIPKKIYNITTKYLNEESRDKFIKNMFDNGKLNPNITITRELPELKDELISIQKIVLKDELGFDTAIISKNDKIVPYKNQLNFWQNKALIKEINATHCPFEEYSAWSELL